MKDSLDRAAAALPQDVLDIEVGEISGGVTVRLAFSVRLESLGADEKVSPFADPRPSMGCAPSLATLRDRIRPSALALLEQAREQLSQEVLEAVFLGFLDWETPSSPQSVPAASAARQSHAAASLPPGSAPRVDEPAQVQATIPQGQPAQDQEHQRQPAGVTADGSSEHLVEDPWVSVIGDWLASSAAGHAEFTTSDVRREALKIAPWEMGPHQASRIHGALLRLGFEARKSATGRLFWSRAEALSGVRP